MEKCAPSQGNMSKMTKGILFFVSITLPARGKINTIKPGWQ